MRRILLLPVFCFSLITAYSQRTLKDIDENKFRINLPDYWGRNSKVVRILMDKLPVFAEEIKDKEVCGDDCNPAYNIDFYLSYPEIVDQGLASKPAIQPANTRPQFNTVQLIRNNLDNRTNPDPQLVAINTPTAQPTPHNWEVITYYRFECFLLLKDRNENVITRFVLVDADATWAYTHKVDKRNNLLNSEIMRNPLTFLDDKKEEFLPDIYEQLKIVDSQILSLQQIQ